MKHLIEFGLKIYRLDTLTSIERIICKCEGRKSRLYERSMVWMKQFNFGGDTMIIEKRFSIPYLVPVPKKHWWSRSTVVNPAWEFWDNLPAFSTYKEKLGKDKEWIDYCSFVAINTNSVKEFEFVKEQSRIVIDALNEIDS